MVCRDSDLLLIPDGLSLPRALFMRHCHTAKLAQIRQLL